MLQGAYLILPGVFAAAAFLRIPFGVTVAPGGAVTLLHTLSQLIPLGTDLLQFAVFLYLLTHCVIAQADDGTVAAFLLLLQIKAAEIAPIAIIPPHHFNIIQSAAQM